MTDPAILRAASHTSRILVDGTLAMVMHFEPADAIRAMQLFGAPGSEVYCAKVKPIDDKLQQDKRARKPIAQWLAIRCSEEKFQHWLSITYPGAWSVSSGSDEERAAQVVRGVCGVVSRGDIDGDPAAQHLFDEWVRKRWLAEVGASA